MQYLIIEYKKGILWLRCLRDIIALKNLLWKSEKNLYRNV